MSIVRKFAIEITRFIVKRASAGSREWAEALASELQSIESDWQALSWAISGARVLLTHAPVPIDSLTELGTVAQKYADVRRQEVNNVWLGRNLLWLVLLIPAFTALGGFIVGQDRHGNAAIVLGLVILSILQYFRSREPVVPDRDDLSGLILFYKQELTRSSDLSLPTFWLFLLCMLLVAAGYEMKVTFGWARLLAVCWVGIAVLFLYKQAKNRRRLIQIEALLKRHQ